MPISPKVVLALVGLVKLTGTVEVSIIRVQIFNPDQIYQGLVERQLEGPLAPV
jgi:hypothetical protein